MNTKKSNSPNQQGAYINYYNTEDKRIIFKWIVKKMDEIWVSKEDTQYIKDMLKKKLILNIPVSEKEKDPYSVYNKMKYQEMWEILRIFGISVYDFLKDIDIEVPELLPEGMEEGDRRKYLSKDISDLYRDCDSLFYNDRQRMLLFAKSLAPVVLQSKTDDGFAIANNNEFTFYRDGSDIEKKKGNIIWKSKDFSENPGRRAYWLMRRKGLKTTKKGVSPNSWGDEEWAVELYKRVLSGKEWEKPIHLEDMPGVAACLGMSLHDMLCVPDDVYLYAKESCTESIVSLYYFFSAESKKLFRSVLDELLTNRHFA